MHGGLTLLPWDFRLPAPCLLGPRSCLALGSPLLPLCPGALVEETRVPISHCCLQPWRALGCLRPGKVVAGLSGLAAPNFSGAPHLLRVQVPRMSPHRGCHFLESCIPHGLGLWAQGKGMFSSLLSWDTVFLFSLGSANSVAGPVWREPGAAKQQRRGGTAAEKLLFTIFISGWP